MKHILMSILVLLSMLVACDSSDMTGPTFIPVASGASEGTTTPPSFEWLGSFATAPESPSLNQAYYNTTLGNAYIYNGSAWTMLIQNRDLKVYDSNSVFMGWAVGVEYVMSPTGYLYSIRVPEQTLQVDFNNTVNLQYTNNDCTGTAYAVSNFDYNSAIGAVLYNKNTNKFYKRKSSTLTNFGSQSRNDGFYTTCYPMGDNLKGYEYEEISRADAGIPATITPPFNFSF